MTVNVFGDQTPGMRTGFDVKAHIVWAQCFNPTSSAPTRFTGPTLLAGLSRQLYHIDLPPLKHLPTPLKICGSEQQVATVVGKRTIP